MKKLLKFIENHPVTVDAIVALIIAILTAMFGF